jgi:hypothetical protein
MIIGDDGLINVDVGGNNGGNGALIDINVDDGVIDIDLGDDDDTWLLIVCVGWPEVSDKSK